MIKRASQAISNPSFSARRGFTIVELLIVIVVIAILASITIVAYNGVQNRAKASAAQSSTKQAGTKIQSYAAQHADIYPATLTDAGLSSVNGVTYQYRVNNDASPRNFCLTATTNSVSYYVSNTAVTPVVGSCTGHIANNGRVIDYQENFEAGNKFTDDSRSVGTWAVQAGSAFDSANGLAQTAGGGNYRIRFDPLKVYSGPVYIEGMARMDASTGLTGVSFVSVSDTSKSVQVFLDNRPGGAIEIRENYTSAGNNSSYPGSDEMIGTWYRLRLELDSTSVNAYMYAVDGTELARASRTLTEPFGDAHPGITSYAQSSFDKIEAGTL